MSSDTFNFSSSNFSFSNYNLDDITSNGYVDENGEYQEIADLSASYDNTVKDNKYEHYTGDSVFGEEYNDNNDNGWNG